MLSTIRSFKRHYHKAKDAAEAFEGKDSLQLKISGDQSGFRVDLSTPPEKDTVRFAVLMHRFLDAEDPLYYRKVWSELKDEFSTEIGSDDVKHTESVIEGLNQGYITIKYNDDELTPARIYEIISKSGYFSKDEEVAKYLREITDIPMTGQILNHQFYEYSIRGFMLISTIFDVLLKIEQSEKFKSIYGSSQNAPNKCIFCLGTQGTFKSEEHIFPEALGNDDLVLPRGFVCDTCNNRILSILDTALLKTPPVAFLQVYFVPYTKSGKLPKAEFFNMTMEKKKPLHIQLVAKDKTENQTNQQYLADGRVSFTQTVNGQFNVRLVARSLYKIALGMIAFERGHEAACDSRYDMARLL